MSDYPCLSCGHDERDHGGTDAHAICTYPGCDCEQLKDEPSQADFDRMADAPSAGERREAYEASWAEHVRLHS